jgi:hypothetical protein
MATLKFDQVISINNQKLDKHYIQSLSKEQRLELIEPIFHLLRGNGWIYPDDLNKVKKSWKSLQAFYPDLNNMEVFNNSSLATDICKHFCHKFYLATERDKKTLLDNFQDDKILKRIIENRLGLDWLEPDDKGPGVNEAFNLSFKMIAIQGQRSMRLTPAISMFKPSIAKYLAMKYSQEGDLIHDYSCGFGGRLLGTISAKRRYIGTDPWTVDELENMGEALLFDKSCYTLIKSKSEDYRGDKNSIDFSYSSPPYYSQEYYSSDLSQAYNKGEDYFYNTYWAKTLENVKYMLKPGKWFGLNILAKYDRVIQMAKEQFGEPVEQIGLKTIRSHLTKTKGVEKLEYVYMFKNIK